MILRRALEHLGKFSRPAAWARRGWECRKPHSLRKLELRRYRRAAARFFVEEQME